MSELIRVCHLDEIPEGAGREFAVRGRVVALFRNEEGVFAIDGLCPHAGGPIGTGQLRKSIVTCPWHGWQFDIRTGQSCLSQSVRTETFPVVIEEGTVCLKWPDAAD